MIRRPPRSTLFPYHDALPILVGHSYGGVVISEAATGPDHVHALVYLCAFILDAGESLLGAQQHQVPGRSEDHTSELQSRQYLVCRLLLEKKHQLVGRNSTRLN